MGGREGGMKMKIDFTIEFQSSQDSSFGSTLDWYHGYCGFKSQQGRELLILRNYKLKFKYIFFFSNINVTCQPLHFNIEILNFFS